MSSPAAAWRYPCRPRARNEAPGIGLTTATGVRSAPEAVIGSKANKRLIESHGTQRFQARPLMQAPKRLFQHDVVALDVKCRLKRAFRIDSLAPMFRAFLA